jgi:chaperonin GroES
MSTFRPLSDYVLLKPIRETHTASGIVIPDTVNDRKSDRGEVIGVGPGKIQEDGSRSVMDVKPGDTVLFSNYAADDIEVDGEELLIIQMHDCKATISN